MKKVLALIIIVASLSCNTNRQAATTGSQIGLRNLPHYYLKNSVELNSNYNGMVIANESDFENLFYAETPADKSLTAPDFKGQVVVALALNRNGNDKMVFAKAEVIKNTINIYGRQETVQNETDSPIAVATVPKCSDAKQVNFFIDGKLVKSVTVSIKTNASAYASTAGDNATTGKETKKIIRAII